MVSHEPLWWLRPREGGSVVPGDKGSILFVGRRVLYNGCTRVHSRIGLKAGRGFKLHESSFVTGRGKRLRRYKEKETKWGKVNWLSIGVVIG